jgi:hypothetical protein
MRLTFASELWLWENGSWYFLTVPGEESDVVRDLSDGRRKGFGSVRVRATIGTTSWNTSLFPESKSGCFVLPCKKAVRKAEDLEEGAVVAVAIELLLD